MNETKSQPKTESSEPGQGIATPEPASTARQQLEREIQERRLYLESVLACAPDAIVTLDARHIVQEWNLGAEKLFGYSAAEATGRNLDLLIAGPNTDVFEEATGFTRTVLSGNTIPPARVTRYRKDGAPVNVILSAAPILLENKMVGVAAVYTDITRQVRVEEALRHRVEQLTALSQASQAITSSLQVNQVLAAISSLASQVTAADYVTVFLVDEAGHIGRSTENLPDVPSIEFRVRDGGLTTWIVRSGRAVIVDEIDADGVMFPDLGAGAPRLANPPIVEIGVRSIAGLPLIARGKLRGVLYLHSLRQAAFHDQLSLLTTFANHAAVAIENARLYEALEQELAERKQAEEALRASEEYTRNIIASSLDTIIAVDMERYITEFNRAAQETFGYRPEEILGKHVDVLYADPQEGFQVHRTTIEKGRCVREVSSRRKDGTLFPSLVSASALRDAHGDLVGVMGVSRDITTRKQAEEALLRRNRELGLLNRVSQALTSTLDLGRVISMVLEEVRRLLNVIACSAWLVDKKTNELVCLESTGPQNEMVRGWRLAPGEGIAGWTVAHGTSSIVADAWTDGRYFDGVDRQTGLGLRSILTVPLRAKEQVIGVLQVLDTEANRFSEADLDLLEPLVASAAIAIENARLYEEMSHRLAQTEVLREMMLAAASTLNFDQVLERTIETLENRLKIEYLGFMLPVEGGEFMQSHPAVLGYTLLDEASRFPTDSCIAGQVYRTGRPVILPDVRGVENYAVADENVLSELAVPVRVGDEVVAVLNLESSKLDAFGEDELEFYTAVAGQLGVAMDNARLYEQAQRDAEIKSTLLREVNHRVQNNLTAIIGLLSAETGHVGVQEQPVYQSIMQNLVNRVQGLATVHSMLSASEWAPLLLHELTEHVIHSSLQMLPLDKHISVDITPSPARVPSGQAHDLALVINELATNTVKHGMPGRDMARITVNIALAGDTVVFEFRDDGPGYPDCVLQQTSSNVGFDLIRNIVSQNLRGELALHNDHGAVAVIRFGLLVAGD